MHPLLQQHPPRLINALFREVREELGFDLAAAFERGDAHSFDEMGVALTPPFAPVRFNTHFFRIDLRQRPEFKLEISEIESGDWHRPAALMAAYERGELLVAPPTLAVIRTLAADPAARRIENFRDFDLADIPVFETIRGVRHYFVLSNTLPPADRTNCFLLGDEDAHRILVDPSPRSREELERLCAQVAAVGFHEVFLTHHHPDHHEHADEIARRFRVPLAMSLDTETRIRSQRPQFFDGLKVNRYADGDVVTRWLGHPLRVVAVPGHDEGQLALMPDNRAFCIVGDLIQGVGTVVISAPEGDMAKYFATLEKVIALAPKVIYPSHGTALGGTFYLEQTLKHRRAREAQIKALDAAGRTMDEMLAEIYVGVDPRLLPLARRNIESHLAKLHAEAATAG
ncbi:MAG: hypothetical protein NVS9B10_16440 [Nevskia sp.]